VSTPERDTAPVGEEIHLPGPTVVPALTGVGITLALVGLTTFIELTIAGGLLTLGCALAWIKSVRADVDELPLD
jgi:hypothetical protein